MSTTLSAAEIEDIRSTLESEMFQTATIKRVTTMSDGMGGRITNPPTSLTTICRVTTAEKRPGFNLIGKIVGERVDNRDQYMITFPHNTDVREDDLVEVEGRVFRITSVLHGDWEFSRRATAMLYDYD